ncbi:thioredoxin domain-containing protein [Caldalkalibacillus salinus]|uniref:thioredoxin domain-containing protein n=1 Tax=Caldalkalibacillus salinus TaxID=2803787 RepID=UPI001F1BB25F|nr:thioredoxin domain-containing protein [Caldalkalibacillus salinus]
MQPNRKPNLLVSEKSPYLLQHAYNPVNWFQWGKEAFTKAKNEDKPIFLSIGYSTCHWCHVMERESFEDEEVAKMLNEHFISIKVDKEERPDIDHIYMTVCQALTGQGGWPLTVFLTPEQKPFYAGTYFPRQSMYGRPGLVELLDHIQQLWDTEREKINATSDKITRAIQEPNTQSFQQKLSTDVLEDAADQLEDMYDETHGGFGQAPKFPSPHQYLFLLREWKRTGNGTYLKMVERSLMSMHRGGIYDHIGYGFARYSVDRYWLVPHFEKMLYDNALLAYTYLDTFQATKDSYFASIAEEIFDYVHREMTSSEGGFYSAQDADSEGEEGKFYVWNPLEINDILGDQLGSLFCDYYDVTNEGNFEGKNILNLIESPSHASFAQRKGMSPEELTLKLKEAREHLFTYRQGRVPPHKDDKILTSWNGLMIAALAKGGAVLQSEVFIDRAEQALSFIEDHLIDHNGRLLARYRDGEGNLKAYIDDFAFLIFALHELYFATGQVIYVEKAQHYLKSAVKLFWDEKEGGFFFYGRDAEQLLTKPKEQYDAAIPSGNSVMALNLVRQFHLTGDPVVRKYMDEQLALYTDSVYHYPAGYTFYLCALQMVLSGPEEIVLVEGENKEHYQEALTSITQSFSPFSVLVQKTKAKKASLDQLTEMHKDKLSMDNKVTLYLCQNFSCQTPIVSVENIQKNFDHT